MKFHFSSFLLGSVAGAATVAFLPRSRPVLIELATTGFQLAEGVATTAATRFEDLEDLLAEARARAKARVYHGETAH